PQSWKDLAFIAVAIGPGGFTGTRIGVVAARTLAQQLELPLFGASSLAAIAHEHSGTIAVQMPAQRGELYTAIYQDGTVLQLDSVMSAEQWAKNLEQYQIDQRIEAESNQGQYVERILAIAVQRWQKGERPHWSEALPYYGQHPVEIS
ncbi:tRNA (adenosine(37)-N6)-threonylcarbamoyltransferase complex dimerization subunit type 1 TsaB, partial [Pseudanabaenaceae cyanobacterium LEGE 13415]|nr:tRNA (adenosine(37)-N6)-threonylcarbamoyltransferase complex dimerization subunit type 1 TsaB [Pseudanabaenaceae cyanobacterium LEGE 13415]